MKVLGIIVLLAGGLLWGINGGFGELGNTYPDASWPTIVLFATFFLCFILTVPIGIALGVATLAAIATSSIMNYSTIVRSLYQGANSFPLMAVPFFVLAGTFMS